MINAKDTNDKVAAWFDANDNSKARFADDALPYGDVTILCGACSKKTAMCRSAPPPSLAPDEPSISTPTPDVVPSWGSSRRRADHLALNASRPPPPRSPFNDEKEDTFRTWWGKKTYSLKHGETCGMDLMCAPGFHPAVGHVSCDTGTLAGAENYCVPDSCDASLQIVEEALGNGHAPRECKRGGKMASIRAAAPTRRHSLLGDGVVVEYRRMFFRRLGRHGLRVQAAVRRRLLHRRRSQLDGGRPDVHRDPPDRRVVLRSRARRNRTEVGCKA